MHSLSTVCMTWIVLDVTYVVHVLGPIAVQSSFYVDSLLPFKGGLLVRLASRV